MFGQSGLLRLAEKLSVQPSGLSASKLSKSSQLTTVSLSGLVIQGQKALHSIVTSLAGTGRLY